MSYEKNHSNQMALSLLLIQSSPTKLLNSMKAGTMFSY